MAPKRKAAPEGAESLPPSDWSYGGSVATPRNMFGTAPLLQVNAQPPLSHSTPPALAGARDSPSGVPRALDTTLSNISTPSPSLSAAFSTSYTSSNLESPLAKKFRFSGPENTTRAAPNTAAAIPNTGSSFKSTPKDATADTLEFIRSKQGTLSSFMTGLLAGNQATASTMGRWISRHGRSWLESALAIDKSGTFRAFCHDTTMEDLVKEGDHLKKLFASNSTLSETLEGWSLESIVTAAKKGAPTIFRALHSMLGIDPSEEDENIRRDRKLVSTSSSIVLLSS
jgi:hypothetical protein